MINQDIIKIKQIISSRRNKTNCFSYYTEILNWIENDEADIYLLENNIFIFYKANGFFKFYYYVTKLENIKLSQDLLNEYKNKSDISLEFTTKNDKDINEISTTISAIGFNFQAEFVRLLSGTNKLRIDKNIGYFELASQEDKRELLEIINKEFNIITDNIPKEEELTKLIENKCIAIKHIDDKIVFIQIYEYSKGSLYSRMTWIEKKYRKPKYTVDFFNGIDEYVIKQLGIKDYKNLRCYYWVDTSIKNYKIGLKLGSKLDGIKCIIFIYKNINQH